MPWTEERKQRHRELLAARRAGTAAPAVKRPKEAPTKLELAQSAEITDLKETVENLAMRVADEQLKREAAEQEAVEWRGMADRRAKIAAEARQALGVAETELRLERDRRILAEANIITARSERDRARGYLDAVLDQHYPRRPEVR